MFSLLKSHSEIDKGFYIIFLLLPYYILLGFVCDYMFATFVGFNHIGSSSSKSDVSVSVQVSLAPLIFFSSMHMRLEWYGFLFPLKTDRLDAYWWSWFISFYAISTSQL